MYCEGWGEGCMVRSEGVHGEEWGWGTVRSEGWGTVRSEG